jgi:cysteine synthase A
MKDRMARAMIEAAERDGRLQPGGTVIESTGGSTGTSLALQCAAKGYPLQIVIADAFSLEKRNHMRALGAELTVIPSDQGKLTKELVDRSVATARAMSEEYDWFFTDQLNNADQVGGYTAMGEEIWEQTGGRIDAFVQSVGSSGSLRGTATALRSRAPGLHVVGVEPRESAVLSGGPAGAHRIEGMGLGYTPPLWDPSLVDEIEAVSTDAAASMAQRLARDEAIFGGTSTGANLVAARLVAERLGPDATVVTVIIDHGLKYVSTDLYS